MRALDIGHLDKDDVVREILSAFGEVEKIPSRYCDKVQIITALIMAGKYIGGDDFEVWTDSEEGGLYS